MKNEQEFFKTNQDNVLVRIVRLEQKTSQHDKEISRIDKEISRFEQKFERLEKRLEKLEGVKIDIERDSE